MEPLPASRNDPCFCGSGTKFRRCCGSLNPDRPPPHGVNLVRDFLDIAECRELIARFKQMPADRLTVGVQDKTNPSKMVRIYDDSRVCSRVVVGELQQRLNKLVFDAVNSKIEPAVEKQFEWFEAPQILKYEPGGFFTLHADNGYQDVETGHWIKSHDRDYSMLIYLGDHFEGGDIVFENFNYRLSPKPGMLVFFPSDERYMHTAQPVTAGVRYALVSWLSELGIKKVMPKPPEETVYITDFQH